MVYINIPYVPENDRIDKDFAKREIQLLDINDTAKQTAYAAIYNLNPRGVNFESKDSVEAIILGNALKKLGIPYRESEEPEYYSR
jgi:hypothetical protein